MPPELKQKLLDLLERARAAVDAEDLEALQKAGIEAMSLVIMVMGKDIDGLLPMVIMEGMP